MPPVAQPSLFPSDAREAIGSQHAGLFLAFPKSASFRQHTQHEQNHAVVRQRFRSIAATTSAGAGKVLPSIGTASRCQRELWCGLPRLRLEPE